MMIKYYWSFLSLALALTLIGANGYSQRRYTIPEIISESNGLPHNEVRCMLKDSKGYLWIGTLYGLAKYDGVRFSTYQHQPDANSIAGDVISTIYEDSNSNILVGANGLSILNRETGKWRNYLYNPNDSNSISNPGVLSIIQESDSIYWILGYSGIDRFNIKTGSFSNVVRLNTRAVSSKIVQVNPGKELIYTIATRVYKYNLKNKEVTEEPAEAIGENNFLTQIGNYIYSLTGDGHSKTEFVSYSLDFKKKHSLCRVRGNNNLLFASGRSMFLLSDKDLLRFNDNGQIIDTIRLNFSVSDYSLSSEFLCGLAEDNGTVWIGTATGLLKIIPNSSFHLIDEGSGLPNSYIRSLAIDSKGTLWIGVKQGALYYSTLFDVAKGVRTGSINKESFPTSNGEVFATNKILEVMGENLLLLTNSEIFLYSIPNKQFVHSYKSFGGQYFAAIDIDEEIFIGSIEQPALQKINVKNGRLVRDSLFQVSNTPDAIYSMYKGSDKQIWIGGEGLFRLNYSKKGNRGEVETVIPPLSTDNHTSNAVWNITEIDSCRLLICTTTNGIYVYNKSTEEISHFTKNDGLASDFTCSVERDANGSFWLSTKEGISFFDTADYSFSNFIIKKGSVKCDFNFKSSAKCADGSILFGSKQGIILFNPADIKPDTLRYPLFVNEFKVFDDVVRQELTNLDTIVVNHDENFFSFQFSLLDFRNKEEVSYEYQLMGYDKHPRAVGESENVASYTDVPPGKYLFWLKAYNSGNGSMLRELSILLEVTPAFYQTTAFKIILTALAIMILALAVLLIVRRQMLQGRLYKMELDLLRSQINPHFIFNTLTSIQQTILMNDKMVAANNLSRFARLMRMCLDYSRLDVISLDKAIAFYRTYISVESVNLDEEILFTVSIDDSIDAESVYISPMLIQPFIENSIIHGLSPKNKDMHIELSIEKEEQWLLCTVTDNGIGRQKAAQTSKRKAKGHQSMGIELSKQQILMQLQRDVLEKDSIVITDCFDSLGTPTGTSVSIRVPFKVKQ